MNIDPIIESLRDIREDQREMRQTLQEMSQALSKLAVVEERVFQTQDSLRRAFENIENHDQRLHLLERNEPEQTKAAKYVHHAVWAAACAAVYFVARQAGLA